MFRFSKTKRTEKLMTILKGKRLDQLHMDFDRDKKYLVLSERQEQLYEKLKKTLTEEYLKDLIKYSDTSGDMVSVAASYFYDQGFYDCISLARLILLD